MASTLKRRLRRVADQAARMCGVIAHRERTGAQGLTVLMYHRVLPDARCVDYPLPSLAMPVSAFSEQMRWLVARGDVLPLGRALERIGSGQRGPRPLFAITVDDGYGDSAEFAAPALEQAGVRGTFFVTTGFVGTTELLWFDRAALLLAQLAEHQLRELWLRVQPAGHANGDASSGSNVASWIMFLKNRPPNQRRPILDALKRAVGASPSTAGYQAMTVEQLMDLHDAGHEIGSHTVTHALLPDLDDDALQSEVDGARATLADWLGTEVPGFCYPFGNCDERVVRAVTRAGHAYACTTRDGLFHRGGDPFLIHRVDIVPERVLNDGGRFDPTAFRRELCGLYRRRARTPAPE